MVKKRSRNGIRAIARISTGVITKAIRLRTAIILLAKKLGLTYKQARSKIQLEVRRQKAKTKRVIKGYVEQEKKLSKFGKKLY